MPNLINANTSSLRSSQATNRSTSARLGRSSNPIRNQIARAISVVSGGSPVSRNSNFGQASPGVGGFLGIAGALEMGGEAARVANELTN